ncbi:hypothetical protein AI2905V1_4761 (plasmid) [Enterobacter cloacae]|nr:hypothetical protein [Enterobacter hormaechei]CAF9476244.1 hypothetical protein AI2905V1_4761 [Enterobacter cloacae]CAH5925131.1 hypothetical protein AI2905V1_4761 [Enterobacter cloacae]CAH5928732.1 hypothetical protein AI2916V1_4771 [Enterobacter cloacae]
MAYQGGVSSGPLLLCCSLIACLVFGFSGGEDLRRIFQASWML